MAETRKYDPSAGDPIGDAIRAAMGEAVRPNTPGAKPDAASGKPAPKRPTITTIGGFTFAPAPAPKTNIPDADAD